MIYFPSRKKNPTRFMKFVLLPRCGPLSSPSVDVMTLPLSSEDLEENPKNSSNDLPSNPDQQSFEEASKPVPRVAFFHLPLERKSRKPSQKKTKQRQTDGHNEGKEKNRQVLGESATKEKGPHVRGPGPLHLDIIIFTNSS